MGRDDVARATIACSPRLLAGGELGQRCLSTGEPTDQRRAVRIFLPAARRGERGQPRSHQFRGSVPCTARMARLHRASDIAVFTGLLAFVLLVGSVPWVAVGAGVALLATGWFLPDLDPLRIEVDVARESAVIRGVHPDAVDEVIACGAWLTT